MISATGFEPATYGLEVRCSDPLSYADISANGRVLNIRGMFAQHRPKRSGDFEPAGGFSPSGTTRFAWSLPLLHQLSDYGKKAAASILETTACIDNISFEDQVFLLWMAMYSIPQLIDQQLDCDWRLILREICLMVIIVFIFSSSPSTC